MHDRTDFEIFARVVATGSLTSAGSELGISPAVVSKRLQRLEQRLAARLLHRTTRRVTPTEVGNEFYRTIAPIVDAITEAEAMVSNRSAKARGSLRVTAPSSFGRLHIVPHLSAFFAAYPDIVLSLDLSDDFERIVERGLDLAIRIGALADSGLTARRLAPVRRVLCARPDYLDRIGRPLCLDDLRLHVCLATENQNPWRLSGPTGTAVVPASGPLRTNSNEVVREAVISGLGISLRSTWDVSSELRDGRLEVVLPQYTAATAAGIYAVYPSRKFVPAKSQAFIQFFRDIYRKTDPWPRPAETGERSLMAVHQPHAEASHGGL